MKNVDSGSSGWRCKVIDITYSADADDGSNLRLEDAIARVCAEAEAAAREFQFLVLSDRRVSRDRMPVSALLAAGAVHHHLIQTR